MKKTKLFVLSIALLSLILSVSLIASAEGIQPYGLPTISSTTCRTCGSKMAFQESEFEYQDVLVQPSACPVTEYWADGNLKPHVHRYELRYDYYECPSCGQWGRMLAYKTMISCQASMKSSSY